MSKNKKRKIIIHCCVVLAFSMIMFIINKEPIISIPFVIANVTFSYSVFLVIFKFIKKMMKPKKKCVQDSSLNSMSEKANDNIKQGEVNFSSNKTVLDLLVRFAVTDLIKYNRIVDDNNVEVTFGYVYQDSDEKMNALYKVKKDNNTFYYVCEKGNAYGVNITEEMYQERLKNTFMNHKCLQTLDGADTTERNINYEIREENLMNDRESKEFAANLALKYLIHNKKIDNPSKINIDFGYIYLNKSGTRESLFKVIKENSVYYFQLKNEFDLTFMDWNEEQYNKQIEQSKKEHECLNNIPLEETESQKNRREKNNNIIKSKGIICNDSLLCNNENRNLKDIDILCKRAIASLLTIQVACDINYKRDVDYSIEVTNKLLDKFGVKDYLNSKEKRIMNKTYTEQDAIDMDWEYESYWALCWILGLVDDISDGGMTCDCDSAIRFVLSTSSFEDFKSKCKLRSKEEILDMEDLYFRYEWAINENKINLNASIGNLNSSNVRERYRGLKWALSNEDDWYNLSLGA